jgi:hypothetical protein
LGKRHWCCCWWSLVSLCARPTFKSIHKNRVKLFHHEKQHAIGQITSRNTGLSASVVYVSCKVIYFSMLVIPKSLGALQIPYVQVQKIYLSSSPHITLLAHRAWTFLNLSFQITKESQSFESNRLQIKGCTSYL